MKKLALIFALIFLVTTVSAVPQTEVSYFYSIGCTHCVSIAQSGILEQINSTDNITVTKYETSTNQQGRTLFLNYGEQFGIPRDEFGVPFAVIKQSGNHSYLMGDTPIIENIENEISDFNGTTLYSVAASSGSSGDGGGGSGPSKNNLTLWAIIIAALIDSINPCAFGVLLFLMAVLLSMGSSKRALKAGLTYTLVIFVVYLAAGFGIMQFLSSTSVLNEIQLVAGILIILAALIEIKDFFWEGKGFSLKIPAGAKPLLEKYARKGTLVSIIVLGVLVALVELPCTGAIYLGILSMIAESGTIGIFYLVLYNLIFILPLIILALVVYRGMEVDAANEWVQNNKKYMRLAAGIIMIIIALLLFGII